MKILMINHFPLAGSGSGTYTKNLAVHLAQRGHEVAVIFPENTLSYDGLSGVRLHPVYFTPEGDAPVPSGALPFNLPCFTTHPRSHQTFGDMGQAQWDMYKEAFRRAIAEEVATLQPDIIHGQHVWTLSALAAEQPLPLVITAHGTDLVGMSRWPHLAHYAHEAMAGCQKVVAVSRDNIALLEELFPDQREKITFMRNGYNPGIFFQEQQKREKILAPYDLEKADWQDRPIVIYAGKLTPLKGVDVLLEAAALYESKNPNILTLIVGDGEERSFLEQQARDLGLASVRFLGNVDQDELCRLYNIADVDVVPSRQEAFGLVAIEAMACGLPVIATDQGGLPDFVNGEVGALVPVEDATALAGAIMGTLERLHQAGESWSDDIAAYARAHYAQDKLIQDLEQLYEDCIADTK